MTTSSDTEETVPRGLLARFAAKPRLAIVLSIALLVGPFGAMQLFPDVGLARQVIGGWVLGGFWALCAIPEQFIDF